MGYDVWRDEEGSSIMNAMTDHTNIIGTLADAIDKAYMMIVCISPEYKESSICHTEAAYARYRQQNVNLQLVYVIMYENYHPKSLIRPLDGWIKTMVGNDQVWYPLWNADHLDSSSMAIAMVIGNNAKIAINSALYSLNFPLSEQKIPGSSGISAHSLSGPLPSLVFSSGEAGLKSGFQNQGMSSPMLGSASSSAKMMISQSAFIERKLTTENVETAFACLQSKKSLCPNALPHILKDCGIDEPADLKEAELNILELLAATLKSIPQADFRKALQI
jgi:hypothetical protein